MNHLQTPEYLELRDLILKSEGKTIEGEIEFGCIGRDRHGCEFRLADNDSWHLIEAKDGWGGHGYFDRAEILGLPIACERVLRALGEVYCTIGTSLKSGLSFIEVNNESIEWTLCLPLHEQSMETIKKLTEVLKK